MVLPDGSFSEFGVGRRTLMGDESGRGRMVQVLVVLLLDLLLGLLGGFHCSPLSFWPDDDSTVRAAEPDDPWVFPAMRLPSTHRAATVDDSSVAAHLLREGA